MAAKKKNHKFMLLKLKKRLERLEERECTRERGHTRARVREDENLRRNKAKSLKHEKNCVLRNYETISVRRKSQQNFTRENFTFIARKVEFSHSFVENFFGRHFPPHFLPLGSNE